MTYRPPTLADVIATLHVDRVDDDHFRARQLDNPAHHIVGGHIAGQALMAASLTAPGRTPHSVHVYYVRAGDAREPVDFLVDVARDGGSLSTRQIRARQNGQILLEVLASFSAPIESLERAHRPCPVVSPARRLVGLGTVRPGFAQWCRRQRTDDVDDVQPGGPTGLHRDPGALLRPEMNCDQEARWLTRPPDKPPCPVSTRH